MRNVKSSGSPKVEAKRTTANLPSPTPGSLETRYVGLAQVQPAQEPLALGWAGMWMVLGDAGKGGMWMVLGFAVWGKQEPQLCFAFSVEASSSSHWPGPVSV